MKPTDFARDLTAFLGRYLSATRNLSANTVDSYRDSFMLLLQFFQDHYKLSPERMTLDMFVPERIAAFLDHLENERGCKPATRNQRLAAIHAFVRYLQVEHPDRLLQCQRILAIHHKRYQCAEVCYLTPEEIAAILAQPDLTTAKGRRDAVLLSLLYDTGARVQEMVDLSVRDLRLDTTPAQVQLTGKGRKVRIVPLMEQMVQLLSDYLQEHDLQQLEKNNHPVFFNRLEQRLSRSGIRYLLEKYVTKAKTSSPSLHEHVTPHMLRHSKAMHLLQAGNPLVVIAHLLGHVSVSTTEIYARADMAMKERALASLSSNVPTLDNRSWQQEPGLMNWLRSL